MFFQNKKNILHLRVMNFQDRELREECGVFGIYGVPGAANLVYYGLHALQHRGQEGCGIVARSSSGELRRIKGEGLVTEIFDGGRLASLEGDMAIGHVRYSTTGGGGIDNVQPFLFHHNTGDFAIAHNGNIVNSHQLRRYLEDGAFAFLIMTKNRIYACRDKHGLRPLSIGALGDGYVVSSETCALDVMGAKFIRDLEPGEIVTIDHKGIRSSRYSDFQHHFMCAMEYIYFSRPDSDIEGCNVHNFRKLSGRLLFEEAPADADIVVGVPDSSLSAAMGYAEASGLPYEMGLVKNKYIGRTFIQPSQELRDRGVRMKLSPVKSVVGGKKVVLIDDSVVRGTTSKRIVGMLRDAGATEVHLRIASPQITRPCFYGIDISTYEELLCAHKTLDEVRDILGVDSIAFLSEKALFEAGHRSELCLACFNGSYPTYLYQSLEEANKDGKF